MDETGARGGVVPLCLADAMSDDSTSDAAEFALPTGTVTFVMTDIEGSTRAWESAAGGMAAAVGRCYEILGVAVAANRGVRPLEQGEGDSVVAAFSRASDAVAAALEAQRALFEERWPDRATVSVRMAVHSGEAQLRDARNYFGPVVIRCARIRDVGHGGQVLVSDTAASLVADVLPEGASLVDLGRVRLKDLGRPERVWQLAHADLPREFAGLRGLDTYNHNLPSQLSPLVGRVREAATLSAMVMSERLVTLTGSGGVGKTRLALAVGAELIDRFPGGVWFVELAATGGQGSAARAALRALDVPETPSIAASEQVAVELDERGPSLLILDNCEHTLDDCALFVVELLTRTPNATVAATSRETLGVPGEVTWRVPPLSTPPSVEPTTVEALSQFDAVNLFVDRARRARPSFTVTEANAAAVAQICVRLDGIPLAIELAAARCRHLTDERILNELDDRFRLLTGASRVAMPRQQTLAASVEWSHDLLEPDEQMALRRLGVFAGPFALEAAETVVSSLGSVDEVTVFDLVSRLVDKSLVLSEERQGDTRFRLLETIRVFALDRARHAGELTELRDAHARWWRDRLGSLEVTGPTDDAVSLFEAHHDDIVGALSWSADRDVVLGLELLQPLARILQGAGRAGEAMPACQRLLDPDVEAEHPERWLRAALAAAVPMSTYLGPEVFVDLLGRCERVATTLLDDYRLSVIRWLQKMDLDRGARMVDLARQRGEPYVAALGVVRRAISAPLEAPDQARETLNEALRVADQYPSAYIRSYATAARGVQAMVFGNLPTVTDCGRQLQADRSPAMRRWGYLLLSGVGRFANEPAVIEEARDMAAHDAARSLPGAAETVDFLDDVLAMLEGRVTDSPAPPPIQLIDFLDLIVGRDAVNRGDQEQARAIADRLTGRGPIFEANRHVTLGLLDQDEAHWHRALGYASEHGFRLVAVDALEGLGIAAAAVDSSVEALRLFGAADRLRTETGYRWRFPIERERYHTAVSAARSDLGDTFDDAWAEGHTLDLDAASEYAHRARGERARPRHGWDSLTPTELRVVDLAAAGHTNPQIAQRLLMSRATVKTHLEHIYTKTGTHNRTELAAEATRRDRPNH